VERFPLTNDPETRSPPLKSHIKKLGVVGFLVFLVKGLLWLVFGFWLFG
jgi:hypothetical protein